jgi:predicted HTH transcriptional regulator
MAKREEKRVAEKVTQRLAERLVEGLAESQKQILKWVQANPNISKKELAFKIGISTTAIDKNISH